uniref:Sulfate_transp domain-containing protein n=1 Tax=Heterorhabditis bacteriophora TaxID=37862 RepID=A0A1I7XUM7_HETBA
MPTPTLPRFELAPYLLEEACSIAIVAFAVTVSMGKLFAKKYHYPIDSNQVSSLVSSCIILSVILWFGPLLIKLPMCILSSIVIVVLRSLFVKVTELPKLWKISKMDVLNDDLLSQRVLLLFVHLKGSLRMQFARADILNSISENQFYPSVEDALSVATVLQRDSSEFFSSKSTVHNS